MSKQLVVGWDISTPGWVEGQCGCGEKTGRLVSGRRAQQAMADHLEDQHGVSVDPEELILPKDAPE